MYQGGSEGNSNEETNNKSKNEKILLKDAVGVINVKTDKESRASSDLALIWNDCLISIKKDLDLQVYNAYFSNLKFVDFDLNSNCLILSAPSNLVSNYIKDGYYSRIASFFSSSDFLKNSNNRNADKGKITLQINVNAGVGRGSGNNFSSIRSEPAIKPFVVVKKLITPPQSAVQENSIRRNSAKSPSEVLIFGNFPLGQKPNPKYTFENFIVGNSNQFCHAAAMQVAEKPGESYNPLFIYGGVGLGKTHLMHAIGNSVLKRDPNKRVLYLSSETFTNVLIQSLRQGKMDEFKNTLRNIEVLLIDDIQFMSGKETTQEEFFHTFNALYSSKHQIVITCDKNPAEIPGIEERLSTRFAWGLIADLQAPDFETRVAILKEKAQRESFNLPHDCAAYIAENFASNVRELEGALTRLCAVSSLQNVPLSLSLAENALKNLLQPKMINISVDQIKKVVGTFFGIKVSDMVSKRRNKNLAFPRHIAMYLCRKHTTYSYPEIGQAFGGRDHSSVIHAASSITNKLQGSSPVNGKNLKEVIETLEKSLIYS